MADPIRDRAGRRVAWAAVAVFVVGAVFSGAFVATLAYRWVTGPREADSRTVVRDTPSVLVAVRDLARLQTVTHQVQRIVDLRDQQERLFGLVKGEDAILLVAVGEVTAGVDLTELRDGDVTVDLERRSVRIVLPPARVFSSRLDGEQTYVYSRTTDVLAKRREDLETRARAEAERTLELAAREGHILARAEENAAQTLTTLVRSLGYDRVELRWREE